jgi:hypothetical protein
MLLPFNTSAFTNQLNADDHPVQCKAIVAPFKEEFDGTSDNVLHFISLFTQCCRETGVVDELKFILQEHSPPSNVDMTDATARTAWLIDSRCFTYGNFLIDSSQAT